MGRVEDGGAFGGKRQHFRDVCERFATRFVLLAVAWVPEIPLEIPGLALCHLGILD